MFNSNRIRYLFSQQQLWRILGFLSSMVGLLCYAGSSSFKHLIGDWTPLKISLYTVVSLIIINITLFATKWKHSKSFLFRSHLSFLVLLLTSLYNYLYDNYCEGKPDTFSLISSAAFAFMSLCLSLMDIHLGFETDLLQFYLGLFILQLMAISFKLALLGAAFCYSLIFLHSYLQYSHLDQPTPITTTLPIQIDTSPNDLSEQLYSILGIKREFGETQDTFICNYPQDFESKLKQAIASGFVKECYDVFITWRKHFLNDRLFNMGFHKLNIEDVHKLPMKYLKDDIEQWAKASNDVVERLLPRERHLCNVVFSGFCPFDDLSFVEVCRGLTTQLLNYANAISTATKSPERLFRIVEVFETLDDLLPNMESLLMEFK